jgi:hypothetical protein
MKVYVVTYYKNDGDLDWDLVVAENKEKAIEEEIQYLLDMGFEQEDIDDLKRFKGFEVYEYTRYGDYEIKVERMFTNG